MLGLDSVPAHHRLVLAAEPVSGWHTPASDERLDETWLAICPKQRVLMKTMSSLLLLLLLLLLHTCAYSVVPALGYAPCFRATSCTVRCCLSSKCRDTSADGCRDHDETSNGDSMDPWMYYFAALAAVGYKLPGMGLWSQLHVHVGCWCLD